MNFNNAKEILELPNDFTQDMVKSNYRQLSLKHHPDKGGNTEDFVKITEAHDFLTNNQATKQPNINAVNLNDVFRSFVRTGVNSLFNKKSSFSGFKKETTVAISPREFLEGGSREIETIYKEICSCEQRFCEHCRGFTFNKCNECLGAGIVQQCEKCVHGYITHKKTIHVELPPKSLTSIVLETAIIHLKLDNVKYIVKNNKIYYRYNISLKESLTGFTKTFKDPFDNEHIIKSKTIVKPNDGYFITETLYLLFNIVYPKELLTQLKSIDF